MRRGGGKTKRSPTKLITQTTRRGGFARPRVVRIELSERRRRPSGTRSPRIALNRRLPGPRGNRQPALPPPTVPNLVP
ncbi:hypothetical protein PGTUg99_035448 [Puccinia graminis f. sp. tritici]|uniref:Uncharacterized protein n=1 Tax=Puccinia graminis f. sp. tritici TaxID=56615 RepID=A0A5B0S8X7_PUCGR|nr:hypothetical protein PGTUg99_035448 [Puccinia graminis f. sp. tritici]